jgi:hypothetical protein
LASNFREIGGGAFFLFSVVGCCFFQLVFSFGFRGGLAGGGVLFCKGRCGLSISGSSNSDKASKSSSLLLMIGSFSFSAELLSTSGENKILVGLRPRGGFLGLHLVAATGLFSLSEQEESSLSFFFFFSLQSLSLPTSSVVVRGSFALKENWKTFYPRLKCVPT